MEEKGVGKMAIRVETLVKEHGKEGAIRILDDYLRNFLMMTTTHFEYRELLEKAKCLVEEEKFHELPRLDRRLEELEHYGLWD